MGLLNTRQDNGARDDCKSFVKDRLLSPLITLIVLTHLVFSPLALSSATAIEVNKRCDPTRAQWWRPRRSLFGCFQPRNG